MCEPEPLPFIDDHYNHHNSAFELLSCFNTKRVDRGIKHDALFQESTGLFTFTRHDYLKSFKYLVHIWMCFKHGLINELVLE